MSAGKQLHSTIKRVCRKIPRETIELTILSSPEFRRFTSGEQFAINAAIYGYTNYYKTKDYMYLKKIFTWLKLKDDLDYKSLVQMLPEETITEADQKEIIDAYKAS